VFGSFSSVYRLILPEFRLRFYAVVAVSVVVALLEVIGVASVMPLVAVVIDPESIARSRVFGGMLSTLGLNGPLPPVYVIGGITITLFIFANVLSLLLTWWSIHFVSQLGIAVSERIAESHFRRPFSFFMANPAAELANQMCNEVLRVMIGGVLQLCFLLSRTLTLLVILALLLIIAPVFSATFFLVTTGIYALIYRLSTKRIDAAGKMSLSSIGRGMNTATEMYGLAREILLRGEGRYFIGRVRAALADFYHAGDISRIYPLVPKYVLEVTAVCALLALPIYRSFMGEDVKAELPLLATFAYAGFRILPVIQQLYGSFSLIRYYQPAAAHLAAALEFPAADPAAVQRLDRMPARLEFQGVGYGYISGSAALSNVSFGLARGERVAVVGASGAGKSTLIDLVLGLLEPSAGSILTDGTSRRHALAWQVGAVGYVPQTPLILNDSIARNIAFGYDGADVDLTRCTEAARAAGIYDVIMAQKSGFDTVIGTETMNFSGGERQRLAIARALYAKPSLLVLDEPGSALDPPTSRKIFELLCNPALDATVLVITHDIEFLRLFDRVVFLDRGKMVMAGSYDELAAKSPEFRNFHGDVRQHERRA
jgi:ABC-type multidrug transport system fused ATPase/permease subunit